MTIFIVVILLYIALSLAAIHHRLCLIHKTLRTMNEQVANVTTEDYRHLSRIRVEGEI